jgi:hypothetical protein
MIRDQEIQRLINYAKGLGLEVKFSSKRSDCSAFWYIDNTGIVIFKKNNDSKIDTILSLIHEIAHAKHNLWEKNRQVDPKFEKAIDHVDEAEEQGTDTQKRYRKTILDNEIAGTKYWNEIYHETNMKFPIWRLEASKEYDVYQYNYFYEHGRYPTIKERKKKHKEVVAKHKDKYE